MKKIIAIFLLFIFVSCYKKYTYTEIAMDNGIKVIKKNETIRAKDDRQAYFKACRNIGISFMAYDMMKKNLDEGILLHIQKPIYFILLNDKNIDITHTVILGSESKEYKLIEDIYPSVIELINKKTILKQNP